MLEEVWLGWCPHLLEVEAFLLKIRRAGVDGQVRGRLEEEEEEEAHVVRA